MEGEYWPVKKLIEYLNDLSARFGAAEVDLIGYSRGGIGIYHLLQAGVIVRSATVINSRLPNCEKLPDLPLHIIHSSGDQFTPIEDVRSFASRFGNRLTKLSEWEGDHYSIASISRSDVWRKY